MSLVNDETCAEAFATVRLCAIFNDMRETGICLIFAEGHIVAFCVNSKNPGIC